MLLTHDRLDIAFKLFFLENQTTKPALAHLIYKDHIRAFSLGSFTEPGKPWKNTIETYLTEFNTIVDSMRSNGYDESQSIVPLSASGAIIDGSHRVASALHTNTNVSCVRIPQAPHYIYDYQFFLKRDVDHCLVEHAVQTFVQQSPNVYVAFFWPAAGKRMNVLLRQKCNE